MDTLPNEILQRITDACEPLYACRFLMLRGMQCDTQLRRISFTCICRAGAPFYAELIHKFEDCDRWRYAARYDKNGSIVRWFHRKLVPGRPGYLIDTAAEHDNLELIKWAHDNLKAECTYQAMDNAVLNGNSEIVKWLHENRREGCSYWAARFAVWKENLEMLKWLHDNRPDSCSLEVLDWAAREGFMDMVVFLCKSGIEYKLKSAILAAAKSRNMQIVKYLQAQKLYIK